MNDPFFSEILGVSPAASPQEIRQAYRRLVMENHPDRFPQEEKPVQELRMITLTEAYTFLMTWVKPGVSEERGCKTHGMDRAPAPPRAVGRHKDPAYAYYKQGFIHFSLAIHGIAELNQRIAEGKLPGFKPYRVAQDFANSLSLLGAAHGYFTRVVDGFPESVWRADAEVKLKRIERFTKLYRRILKNLGGKPESSP